MGVAATAIGTVLGVAAYTGAVVLACWLLWSRARRSDLLAPVLVGTFLRLGVMLSAHAGSVALGDAGLMFLDDWTYLTDGATLAGAWREGTFIDPYAYDAVGSFHIGYQALVGIVFTGVGDQIVWAKLVNVLLGGATILIVALIARDVLGEKAGRRTAWLVALAPTVVWWSAPLMKEAFATFLVAAALLAALRLPRPAAWATLGCVLLTLVFTRSGAAAVLVVCLGVAVVLAARRSSRELPWTLLGTGALVAALVFVAGVTAVSGGQVGGLVESYQRTISSMIENYQGSNLAAIPTDITKAFVAPLPWAFDADTRNWDRGLYPGMWLLYVLYPVALLGAWRLRHRPEIAITLLPIMLTVAVNSYTSGFVFRQRSTIEPLLLILVSAGMVSWRATVRIGALALPVVGAVAAIQSGSVVLGAAIAAVGAGLYALARLLPDDDLREPLPESPLVGALERLGDSGARAWRTSATVARLRRMLGAPSSDQ